MAGQASAQAYEITEECVGGLWVDGVFTRFAYQIGVVTPANDAEVTIMEFMRSRGLCRYPEPVEE